VGDDVIAGANLTSGKREMDLNSPLYLIKEKELEITGRVLATRQQAEEIVAEARKKAVEVKREAEAEGWDLAEGEKKSCLSNLNLQLERIALESEAEVEALCSRASSREDEAVEFVIGVVTRV